MLAFSCIWFSFLLFCVLFVLHYSKLSCLFVWSKTVPQVMMILKLLGPPKIGVTDSIHGSYPRLTKIIVAVCLRERKSLSIYQPYKRSEYLRAEHIDADSLALKRSKWSRKHDNTSYKQKISLYPKVAKRNKWVCVSCIGPLENKRRK